MKTPVEWDEIPGVADEIIELIGTASREGETEMDGWFEGGRNGYGENGTLSIRVGGRIFQLAAYEVGR